jgi:hypothetical protein
MVRYEVVLHLYGVCSGRLWLVWCVVLDWCNGFRYVREVRLSDALRGDMIFL